MASNYLDSLLGENEKIEFVARQHWTILARSILGEALIALVLAVAISIAVGFTAGIAAVAYILLVVPLGMLTRDVLIWWNNQYVITNRRVIQVRGVFNKNVNDSSLEKVNDVKMEQSFLGRMLDYGDIEILTASELGVNRFSWIGQPVRFKTAMLNAKERMGSDELPRRPASKEDVPAMIEQLDQLRREGLLTEEEFQAKKAQLLSRL
ncbi:MAG TPA: PH domain-containing protein [Anaerolineales bacterium]|nr:PH domain-containing protein [Anaerolineales bacterium]